MNSGGIARVVVVGGGISGLTTAHHLRRLARRTGLALELTLVERDQRLGGAILTRREGGYVIERGPDSFLAGRPEMAELLDDLGLRAACVRNQPMATYVLRDDRLRAMPPGLMMGIPTTLGAILGAAEVPFTGRVRAALDLLRPGSAPPGDVSAGLYLRRRLGDAWVDRLVEPLLSGIHAGELGVLSLQAAFPRLYEAAQRHRSLILALRASGTRRRDSQRGHNGPPAGPFMTLARGLATLVEGIGAGLAPGTSISGVRATRIDKGEGGYAVALEDGARLDADAVVLAIADHDAAVLLRGPARRALEALSPVRPVSVANVVLAFAPGALAPRMAGTGFIVPRAARGYTLTACTWTHLKWPHTVPAGHALIRCYVGRGGREAVVDEDDDVIVARVLRDLERIQGLRAQPVFHRVTRWRRAMPQYVVGHRERLAEVRRVLAEDWPGIVLAGASFGGGGLPDCVRQGKEAAHAVWRRLHGANAPEGDRRE